MEIGKHNRKLVEIRKAFQHGTLTDDGLLPIEGPILIEEAERSGIEIVDLFVRAGTDLPAVTPRARHEVPADVFRALQDTEHSQGLIATVRPREFTIDTMFEKKAALIVVLVRLQDPGNVGTILRVSESFGATGCIALTGTVSLYNSKSVRASAGSIFRLPHIVGAELADAMAALRKREITIVGTAPTANTSIDRWDWTKPVAVLIGNEGRGLSADESSYCAEVLRIPHKQTVESLNSAIAAAVTLYEASKQRPSI